MGILHELQKDDTWQSFLSYKTQKGHLSKSEEAYLQKYVEEKRYMTLAVRVSKEGFCFDYPEKKRINKLDSSKKRVVYAFSEDEKMLLKVIAFLLYQFDDAQSSLCFSFRKNYGAKRAIHKITNVNGIDDMFGYKVDISDYFNSIDVQILLPIMKEILVEEDAELYYFFEEMLICDKCYSEGRLISEKRGVMAGTPTSPFLANIYLRELDRYFETRMISYARYSDDIIVFVKSAEEREQYREYIAGFFERYHLKINTKKEYRIAPHEQWEFLGVSYYNHTIDLSQTTKDKMKGKIRRKARALYRWKIKKGVSDETVLKLCNQLFNYKFYECKDKSELTWSRWFFPLLTVDVGLKEIDAYMQQYLRYIVTGKHGKRNYHTDYGMLKQCDYRSLVNEYYKRDLRGV